MTLDDRKLQVLHAIIQSYITSAEPIGSRTISKKFDLGVSSATIRNEMSDLEELGYLVQPHTSAGRIPSDKGYRLYVNKIMPMLEIQPLLSKTEKDDLVEEKRQIDHVIKKVSKLLSKITNYTAVAISPQISRSSIKRIQIVPIDESRIMIVLVTTSGIVKNKMLELDEEIPYDKLNKITNFLNNELKGYTIDEIGKDFEKKLVKEIYDISSPIISIMPIVINSLQNTEEPSVYLDGVTNIFNFPEYHDLSKAKQFISFVENKDIVLEMLLNRKSSDIGITIGSENDYEEIKSCSVITTTYSVNGKTIGKIGVIGPTRMDYEKVINAVKSISLDLNDLIDKYFLRGE